MKSLKDSKSTFAVALLVAAIFATSMANANGQTNGREIDQSTSAPTASELLTLKSLMGPGLSKVEAMTPIQRSRYLGVNILRVVAACSVSSLVLVATAAGETIPMLSAMTGMAVELGINDKESVKDIMAGRYAPTKVYDLFEEKDALHQVGGGAVSFVTDLVKIANHFLFDEDGTALKQAMEMPNTKAGYSATTTLAKQFYGNTESGKCAAAGRAIVDVLSTL